jgi:AcrR family transcriptional regulator
LEDIAERASMTTGAIYGNFKNRDELFMALAERQWVPIRPKFKLGSGFPELMRALANAVIGTLPSASPLPSEPSPSAPTHCAMKRSAPAFRKRWPSATPSELTEGLVFQRFLTPDLIIDEVIHSAFAALAGQRYR